MKWWDLFSPQESKTETDFSRLHDKISHLFPHLKDNEDEFIKMTCLAGLLARVAFIDFHVEASEKDKMQQLLTQVSRLSADEAERIVRLALEEIEDLSGLENHKYCYPLHELMTQDERYQLLVLLFALGASDGEISEQESEEIRLITRSLNLEHQHFIAARAQYKEFLKMLRA